MEKTIVFYFDNEEVYYLLTKKTEDDIWSIAICENLDYLDYDQNFTQIISNPLEDDSIVYTIGRLDISDRGKIEEALADLQIGWYQLPQIPGLKTSPQDWIALAASNSYIEQEYLH